MQEFFVAVTRKLGVDPLVAKGILKTFAVFEIIQISTALIHEAIDCSILNRLSFWDSLILAAAASAGCSIVFTEDLNPNQTILGMQVQNPFAVLVDTTPLETNLAAIRPLELHQVRHTGEEPLFNSLLDRYHYLGYAQPVGEHLKYLVYAQGRPIACLAWSSAPRHLGPRDRFIGWSPEARRKNIRFLAYNTRYLILPFVEVEHLASHILGRVAQMLSEDWNRVYGHPVDYLETFVDPGRFRGTCYRAANWKVLGLTTGRGKDAPTKKPNRSVKEVLGYPLTRDFRRRLGAV